MKPPARREFLRTLGAGAAAAALPGLRTPSAAEEPKMPRPNILFLLSDDQRHDTLHALGNALIQTPALDALVRRGVAFTHPYIMGGNQGAVCVPSRAMLLTGRTLWRCERRLPEGALLWPEAFRQAGYTTFGTGKWHNGPAWFARCFDGGDAIFFGGMHSHLQFPVHSFDPSGKYPKAAAGTSAKFSSELFSDAAIQFLRSHKGPKPFFLYLAYTAPHDPRMAPRKYQDMYPPDKIPVPRNFLPQHPFDNGELKIRDEQLAPWPRTPEVIQKHIADYYAMITHMDEQIGRVVAALDETGHANDTLVIFAGDNGLALGQHGLMGKQSVYEHSIRVPLVLAGPGIPAGERRDAFAYLLDLFPTACEMAGVPTPKSVEGKSLVPILKGEAKAVRDSVFAAYRDVQRSVSDGRFKLIAYTVRGARRAQLFDLANDPWEMHDLSADPAHAPKLAELQARLAEWQRQTGDPLVS